MALIAVLGMALIMNGTHGAVAEMDDQQEQTAVLIGASYARGWAIERIAGMRVVNAGIDGQQSFELLERFQRDVLARKPSMVIIWGYINDIHRNPRAQRDRTLERARNSFASMVEMARANGIEPVVATEVTIRPKEGRIERLRAWIGRLRGKESYQGFVNRQVRGLNEWLRAYAAKNGIRLLDLEAQLSGPDGLRRPEFTQPDGSHITPAGYERLSAYVSEIMK